MTAPLEGSAQSGEAGAQGGSQTDGTTTDGTTDASAQGGAETGGKTYTEADFAALRNQLSAADKAREAAQREAKTLKDAQLSEGEKTKQDLEEAKKVLQQKEEENKLLRLQNAFVTDNTYDWHDPKAALKLADLSAVTVDEEGTVKGLKEALKKVADSNPWMIKPKSGETAPAGETGSAVAGSTGVSGQGTGAGRSGGEKGSLEKRFPQLRGRTS